MKVENANSLDLKRVPIIMYDQKTVWAVDERLNSQLARSEKGSHDESWKFQLEGSETFWTAEENKMINSSANLQDLKKIPMITWRKTFRAVDQIWEESF